jgi:hypothetical protein
MPLETIPSGHLFHIVVRFMNKTKAFPYKGKLGAPGSLEDVENEYTLVNGHFANGKVYCSVPALKDTTEFSFLVDVAVNGQQYTNEPLLFRYYDVKIEGISPMTGFLRGGTTL